MTAFELISAAAFGMGLLFLVIAFLDWVKPGMRITETITVFWFYGTFGTFSIMAYRVGTTGGI